MSILPSRADAVVVGAGIAGLVAARELAMTGHDTVLLEAGVVGGHVASHTVDGLRLDAGAESFATRNDAVARLAAELGLEVVTPFAAPAWLHAREGVDVPLPRSGIVGIPGDPLAADVVAALGEEAARRAATDLEAPLEPELLEDGVSLGALVRTRLGEAALQGLVTPVVSGVHSADPDELEADAIVPGLRAAMRREGSLCRGAASLRAAAPAGSAVAGLRGGMHALVEALEADLVERGVTVVPETAVSALSHVADGGFTVQSSEGSVHADRLVVATEGPAAVELLSGIVPGLDGLRPEPGAGVSLVTLVVDQPELDSAPRGTGVLVAPGALDVIAKALTHSTAKWPWLADEAGPGRHVVRLSYGRLTDRAARMADADETTLIGQGVADAALLLGVELSPADILGADVVRHDGGLPLATQGARERIAAVRAAVADVEDLDVVGAWLDGTGLTAIVSATRSALGVSVR